MLRPLQDCYLLLQVVQESRCVRAVHLGVMELERNGQRAFSKAVPVFSPNQERIVEYAAVHADCSVY